MGIEVCIIPGFRSRIPHVAVIEIFGYLLFRKVQDGIPAFLKFQNRHLPALKQVKAASPLPDVKAGIDLILFVHQKQIAFI